MATMQLDLTVSGLMSAALHTVRNPREGATAVMNAGYPTPILWMMLAAVVAVSIVLGQGSLLMTAGLPEGLPGLYLGNPLLMWMVQIGLLVVMVYAVHHVGRMMGGIGAFEDALALIVWLQFMMACVQVLQTLALFLAPPVADLVGIVALILFLWLLTHFVAVLHGFQSLGLVFVMILMTAFGITFVLSLILAMVGIGVGETNV